MADSSRYSSEELNKLTGKKIMRYAELLRKAARKSMTVDEEDEYIRLKSELLELHALLQLENEKVCEK